MELLCWDLTCEGHEVTAGDDPEAVCRFCGEPLLDPNLCVLMSDEAPLSERDPMEVTSLRALQVCAEYGHLFEGRVFIEAGRCAGRCSRCGIGIITDGS